MTAEEREVFSILANISKSLAKIASELSEIKEIMRGEQKLKLNESKKLKLNPKHLIAEGIIKPSHTPYKVDIPKTKDEAMNAVRKIRNGEMIF